MLRFFFVNLLDPVTRDKWEERITGTTDPPSFASLKDFLTKRRQQLEASPKSSSPRPNQESSRNQGRSSDAHSSHGQSRSKGMTRAVRTNHTQQNQKLTCAKCGKEHFVMQCPEFKALSPSERRNQVESHRLCSNCLGRHAVATCPSTKSCMACGERHHSSLHDAFRDGPSTTRTALHTQTRQTASGSSPDWPGLRNLDDQRRASSATPAAANGIVCGHLRGRGQQLAKARGRVTLDISTGEGDTLKVSAIVLSKLSGYALGRTTQQCTWSHLQGLKLADPYPAKAKPIEVLLGADVYPAVIKEGVRKGTVNEPVGQLTIFGWIITGLAGSSASISHVQVHQAVVGDSLSSLVRKFWDQEELQDAHSMPTAEEMECESHFTASHSRTPEGRYQVRLPFRKTGPITPGSRRAAWNSLRRMEQRFNKDEKFRTLYRDFVNEYETLGHMSLKGEPSVDHQAHYMPHHGVLKPSSATTKLRVVFNGSWSEPSQLSLNDCLHVGPNLLPLLADVLLRWRRHQYVVTADITKMYRQILVHPEDRNHQRILWRDTEAKHVSEYQLNTVTYGLSCAPFLAVRTLHQLAEDEGSRYPIGALALRHDTYVDDILTGADTIPALIDTATQLQQLCMAGGFPLQKWASNVANMRDVPTQAPQNSAALLTQHEDSHDQPKTWTDAVHSTLGLQWSPREDSFLFAIPNDRTQPLTKRGVVSKAAQLFDPLGWLTPVVIRAKITIQTTCLLALSWDDPLPPPLANEWMTFCADLKQLEKVRIPRALYHSPDQRQRELHGFADASERAYGAVIYLRTRVADGPWRTSLVTAKSKVAPLQQVSLPRLELCAAHLLARLTQRTVNTLHLEDTALHLWSDSTVALGWIQAHPSRWTTYVANRVADIQRRTPEAQWHHVAGVDNPADCASRGLSPSQLPSWTLWWQGPEFLRLSDSFAPTGLAELENLPEGRRPIVAAIAKGRMNEEDNDVLLRFSSYSRLLRVSAWCRRWLRKRHFVASTTSSDTQPPTLSVVDVEEAERGWIRLVQRITYREEIKLLANGQCIPNKSSLASLCPTLDSNGLLRVGGRLSKAPLNPDEAHPIILPPNSRLTHLYISLVHSTTLHGGVQATLGAVRQRYWIPKGRSAVKATINKCVTCLRWRAEPATQLMGQLPAPRVTPALPFHSTGVDYAGPIWLRTTSGRGHKAYKGFLAVFVCLVTKAVHLEVVFDYTAQAFLAAFRRFVSRLCAHLYSDCGTNFLGADRELRRLFTASSQENRSLRSLMLDLRIQWHFNPPAAPHFGGLWEAAVKSTKHHLRRTIGEARLTYEEMTTLLTQVEACLNSRPLTALSDDPTDLTALMPGHFLTGSALNSIPEPSLLDTETNRLTRWKLLSKMRDQFWTRWQREYLQGLTTRSRWRRPMEDMEPGRLCIIVGETTSPAQWPLARIKETHPGADGKVRVAKLTTATTELLRPVAKLIVLPIDANESMTALVSSTRISTAHRTTT
ncbi:uncharacterized protein LOC143218549 [Lasioglossum baleicum]|uniref:uncharacterized protein LOC143218549 n=1 Tax=Lasioglossum baleicum TaxID=434251 RepID=UPI003FCE09CD